MEAKSPSSLAQEETLPTGNRQGIRRNFGVFLNVVNLARASEIFASRKCPDSPQLQIATSFTLDRPALNVSLSDAQHRPRFLGAC